MLAQRIPWFIGLDAAKAVRVGSILPQDLALLSAATPQAGARFESAALFVDPAQADAVLAGWAAALRQAGRLRAWRNELLPVAALPAGLKPLQALPQPLAYLERGASRVLGVLTHAVHVVGVSSTGDIWLQQRAMDKSTDPGLWDTLAGGLLAAGDDLYSGALRETHEEAGLTAADLSPLRSHGSVLQSRSVPDGHILEAVWTFSATHLPHAQPHNLDGEVMGFACVSPDKLRKLCAQGLVTQEAMLALAAAAVAVA